MLQEILQELTEKKVSLVAVSKTKPNEAILDMYHKGQHIFGENKVQELVNKHEALPKDIQWHFIGHLQSNKVKYIASFIQLIHSIDSIKILKEINKQALKAERIIDVLLQVKIAEEESKFGFDKKMLTELLASTDYQNLKNIRIVGVMGMATFTADQSQVRSEFKQLKDIFDFLKVNHFEQTDHFKELSMGMSGDYQLAIEEGSTMVRIGSLLFGSR